MDTTTHLIEGNAATKWRVFRYRGHFFTSEVRSHDARRHSHPGYVWRVIDRKLMEKSPFPNQYHYIGFTVATRAAAKRIIDQWVEASDIIKARLEYLRGEIKDKHISYEEIAELQSLAEHIEPDDMLLREWAGLEEHSS